MDHKCECGATLIFDKQIDVIDVDLVCNRYYCDKCGNEYEINDILLV